jgi:hypothetical protein
MRVPTYTARTAQYRPWADGVGGIWVNEGDAAAS